MFKDKVVLVTGASRGIGRGVALEFGKSGALVCVNFASNEEMAADLVEEITKTDGTAKYYRADVSSESEVSEMIRNIEKDFGTVDILVNNAGLTRDGLFMRMSESDWDTVVDTNLKGAFLCAKAVCRGMMKKRYGKIINISSVVAFTGNPGQANYVSSKSGLLGLTKSLALELSGRGVRVNGVAPGFIDTDMTDKLTESIKNDMKNKIPLGYFGKVEDVASVVKFLASSESDYITGQTIHVNGGMFLS